MAESPFKKNIQEQQQAGVSPFKGLLRDSDKTTLPQGERVGRSFGQMMSEGVDLGEAGQTADDVLGSILQGMTFGFGDEIEAGLRSLFGDRSYDDILTEERGDMERFREESPALAMGTEIAGALPTALATGPLSIARAAIPASKRGLLSLVGVGGHRAGRAMTSQPMKRPALAGRIAKGAAGGTASGAAYGFGAGEDGFGERVESAALPAGFGGVLGAIMPAVAGPIGRYAGETLSRAKTARKGKMESTAVDPMQDVMHQDIRVGGKDFPTSPGAKIADLGPASRADLDEAIQEVGGNADVASRHIRQRSEDASGQLTAALDNSLGSPQGVKTVERALKDDPTLKPLYDQAYATPIDYTTPVGGSLRNIISTRVPGSVIRAANDIMRRQGVDSDQIRVRLGKNDEILEWEKLPDTRQMHYILQGLDSEIGSLAQKEGFKGTLRGATKKLRKELRAALGEANPTWAEAQTRAADDFAAVNALRLGYDAMKPSVMRSEFAEEIGNLSPAERQWVAQGMRERIDDIVANAKDSFVPDPTVSGHVSRRAQGDPETLRALQDLSSRSVRNKVSMVIGDEQAGELFGQIDELAGAYMLHQTASTNLRKQSRERLGREQARYDESPLGKLHGGKPMEAAAETMARFFGKDPDAKANPDTAAAVIEVLLRDATPENVAAMRAVHNAPRPATSGNLSAHLAELLAGRGGLAAIPALPGQR